MKAYDLAIVAREIKTPRLAACAYVESSFERSGLFRIVSTVRARGKDGQVLCQTEVLTRGLPTGARRARHVAALVDAMHLLDSALLHTPKGTP